MQRFNINIYHQYIWHILAFAAIAIGVFLRFYGLDKESLWSDELFTVAAALDVGKQTYWLDFTPKVIQELTFDDSFLTWKAADNTPPLFELLLIGWSKIFGSSDFALRALPAVLSSLSLVVFYFGLKDILGLKATLLGTILFSISVPSIIYSQEVRAYTLAAFFCTIALVRLMHHVLNENMKEHKLWPDIIIFILLAYSHYTGLYMAGLFAGIYLLFISLPQRKFFDAAKFLIVPITVLPWMYLSKKAFVFSSAGGYGWREYHSSDITTHMIPATLNFYAPTVGAQLFYILIAGALAAIFIEKKNQHWIVHTNLKESHYLDKRILLSTLLFFSIFLLFLYSIYNSFTSQMWHPRYFMVSVPIIFCMIAMLFTTLQFGKKIFAILIVFIFCYSAYDDIHSRFKNYPTKDQYREASEFLAFTAPNDSLIVLGGNANAGYYRHYLDKYIFDVNRTYAIKSVSDENDMKKICDDISPEVRNIFIFQHSTMQNFGISLTTCNKNLQFIERKQFRGVHIDQYKTAP